MVFYSLYTCIIYEANDILVILTPNKGHDLDRRCEGSEVSIRFGKGVRKSQSGGFKIFTEIIFQKEVTFLNNASKNK